jgi:protease-4
MSISPDYLIERKKSKSQLRKWKYLVVFLIIIIIALISFKKSHFMRVENLASENYIASILIEDIIFEDAKRDYRLEKIIENESVKALIVNINSPGGTVVGSEKIYNILRKISAKKPVVAVMGTLAASGGYLISLGADYIIAHNGTITGSIGVVFQTAEVTELAEKIGIKFNNFKSGELKAAPNPTEKVTEAVRIAMMSNIQDTYEYFVELVAKRRGFSIEEATKLADGRIYSGRQAFRLKLVDAIGDQDDAVKWLHETKKIDSKLTVKEIKLKPKPKLLEILLDDLDNVLPSFMQNKLYGLSAVLKLWQ